jgi:hypothetical protein
MRSNAEALDVGEGSDLPDCFKDRMKMEADGKAVDILPLPPPPSPKLTKIVVGSEDYSIVDVDVIGQLTLQVPPTTSHHTRDSSPLFSGFE